MIAYKKLIEKLDLFISSTILLVLIPICVILFKINIRLFVAPLFAVLACIFYTIKRNKGLFFENLENSLEYDHNSIKLISIGMFVVICFLNIIYFYSHYSRPLIYFIFLSSIGGFIAYSLIFYKNSRANYYCFLLVIFLLNVHLYILPQLMYSDLIGIDPWKHESFVISTLRFTHFPDSFAYSKLPGMHSLIALTSIISNLNYKEATLLSVSLFQAISIIFVFLTAKKIFDSEIGNIIGILAALILSVSSNRISLGFWVHPTTFALIISSLLLYLLFCVHYKNMSIRLLRLVVALILIITHVQIALAMFLTIFVIAIIPVVYKKINHLVDEKSILTFAFIFLVLMLTWWMYISNSVDLLANILKLIVQFDVTSYSTTTVYSQSSNLLEYLTDIIPYLSYYFLALIGFFFSFSNKSNSKYFSLSSAGILIMCIPFFSMLTKFGGLLGERWIYFAQLIMAIPAAIGVCVLFENKKSIAFKGFLLLFMTSFIFFNVINPSANVDNPLDRDSFIRFAHTDAELVSINYLKHLSDYKSTIYTDYMTTFPITKYTNLSVNSIEPMLLEQNFELSENHLMLLRIELLNKPTIKTNHGVPKNIRLLMNQFDKVYNNGVVYIYSP